MSTSSSVPSPKAACRTRAPGDRSASGSAAVSYTHLDVYKRQVLGYDGLGREVRDLLLERDDLGDALDEGQLEVQTDVPGGRCV